MRAGRSRAAGKRERRRGFPGASSGFTLLEIMMALAILGSSLVVLLTSIYHSVGMYRVAQDTLIAGFLAQEKFTELVNSRTSVSIGDSRSGVFEKAPSYSWSYRVEKVGMQPFIETVPGLRRLEVVVSWGERPTRRIDVISYLRDPELRPMGQ